MGHVCHLYNMSVYELVLARDAHLCDQFKVNLKNGALIAVGRGRGYDADGARGAYNELESGQGRAIGYPGASASGGRRSSCAKMKGMRGRGRVTRL